jgi:branched-chain amino acid transport system permease protein
VNASEAPATSPVAKGRSGSRLQGERAWMWAAGAVAWIAAVATVPLLIDSAYYLGLGVEIGIMTTVVLGLILLTGYAGQFSLSQAAFFGMGAYSSGILTVRYGLPPLLALVIGACIAGGIAFLLGRPIFRLRGHFLAMGTLALNEIVYLLFNNLRFTGGSSGFGGIQPFSVAGFSFSGMEQRFYLVWLVAGAGTWFALRLGRSREGRALAALRSHETAAAACGINLSASKTRVFVLSAVFGAIGGSLYAHDILYVNPPPFALLPSIMILVMAVVGGLGSAWGAVVGVAILTVAHQLIVEFLPRVFGAGAVGAGESLVVGAILLLVLVFMPSGVVGGGRKLAAAVAHRFRGRTGAHDRAAEPQEAPQVGKLTVSHPGDGEALLDTLDADGGVDDRSGSEPARPDIVLRSRALSKHFGGVRAVDEVDLELRAGEILGVIGPNGAGKSTLINMLSGVMPPTAGTIEVGDRDITGWPAHRVATLGLARTFQTPSVFAGLTARENVLVGAYLRGKVGMLRSAVPTIAAVREERVFTDEARGLLRELGLQHVADRPVEELPLGYQKVVEIARALAARPSVLLLDEPAAGLNRAEKLEFMTVLRRVRASGVALVLVEHDMELVMALADRVHVLDFGKTLRIGTTSEVQADPAVINAYLGTDEIEEDAYASS